MPVIFLFFAKWSNNNMAYGNERKEGGQHEKKISPNSIHAGKPFLERLGNWLS
jgi:hypothetical protein